MCEAVGTDGTGHTVKLGQAAQAGRLLFRGNIWGQAASAAPHYPRSHIICKIIWMERRWSSLVPRNTFSDALSSASLQSSPPCVHGCLAPLHHIMGAPSPTPPSHHAGFIWHCGHVPRTGRAPAALPHPSRALLQPGHQQLTTHPLQEFLTKMNISWSHD